LGFLRQALIAPAESDKPGFCFENITVFDSICGSAEMACKWAVLNLVVEMLKKISE